MKAYRPVISFLLSMFFVTFFSTNTFSQVGINTTTPNGILDINSTTQGIVLPRIALTATNVAAPVINPQGGAIVEGTVVYNTASTNTGSNDVDPGIYVWDGSKWRKKFSKKQAEIFKQTSDLRTISSAGYQAIPNLTGQTFTAKYTGTYKIEVSVNYGGGQVLDNSPDTDVLSQSGNFRFTFNGTNYDIPAKCFSTRGVTGGSNYYLIWEQSSIILNIDLVAGTTYNFDLQFDQNDSPGFIDDGNSGDGMGYIGYDIPCSVEFIYIGLD